MDDDSFADLYILVIYGAASELQENRTDCSTDLCIGFFIFYVDYQFRALLSTLIRNFNSAASNFLLW
jgi:hypothetical protein